MYQELCIKLAGSFTKNGINLFESDQRDKFAGDISVRDVIQAFAVNVYGVGGRGADLPDETKTKLIVATTMLSGCAALIILARSSQEIE